MIIDTQLINNFFASKDIYINNDYFSYKGQLDESQIINQLNLIIKVQKILCGSSFNLLSGVNSTIGKNIEEFKVQIKVLRLSYKDILNKKSINDIEKYIIANGKNFLNQAQKVLDSIEQSKSYYSVIKRSMNRKEVALGRVDFNNLRMIEDSKIQVGTIKNLSYNLIEDDIYNFIKRLQKKKVKIDTNKIIKYYVYNSHLSYDSLVYLRLLCLYPKHFLKNWQKYINNKYKTEENILNEFTRAYSFERDSNY